MSSLIDRWCTRYDTSIHALQAAEVAYIVEPTLTPSCWLIQFVKLRNYSTMHKWFSQQFGDETLGDIWWSIGYDTLVLRGEENLLIFQLAWTNG